MNAPRSMTIDDLYNETVAALRWAVDQAEHYAEYGTNDDDKRIGELYSADADTARKVLELIAGPGEAVRELASAVSRAGRRVRDD